MQRVSLDLNKLVSLRIIRDSYQVSEYSNVSESAAVSVFVFVFKFVSVSMPMLGLVGRSGGV